MKSINKAPIIKNTIVIALTMLVGAVDERDLNTIPDHARDQLIELVNKCSEAVDKGKLIHNRSEDGSSETIEAVSDKARCICMNFNSERILCSLYDRKDKNAVSKISVRIGEGDSDMMVSNNGGKKFLLTGSEYSGGYNCSELHDPNVNKEQLDVVCKNLATLIRSKLDFLCSKMWNVIFNH